MRNRGLITRRWSRTNSGPPSGPFRTTAPVRRSARPLRRSQESAANSLSVSRRPEALLHSRNHKEDFWEHVGTSVNNKKNPRRNPLPGRELQEGLDFVPRTGFTPQPAAAPSVNSLTRGVSLRGSEELLAAYEHDYLVIELNII